MGKYERMADAMCAHGIRFHGWEEATMFQLVMLLAQVLLMAPGSTKQKQRRALIGTRRLLSCAFARREVALLYLV